MKIYNNEMIQLNNKTRKTNTIVLIVSAIVDLLLTLTMILLYSKYHFIQFEIITYISNIIMIFVLISELGDNQSLKQRNALIKQIMSFNGEYLDATLIKINEPIKIRKNFTGFILTFLIDGEEQIYYYDSLLDLSMKEQDKVRIKVFNNIITEYEVI